MGSVPHYLHLFRIRPTNSSSSVRSPANRQNRLTPCAKDPHFTPGIFPATSTNRQPKCRVATATTPSRPQSPCPSHISRHERPRLDSAVDTISCQSGRTRPRSRTAPAIPKPIRGTPGDRRADERGFPRRSHGSSQDTNHHNTDAKRSCHSARLSVGG